MRAIYRVPGRGASIWSQTISSPERCVPLWGPDRIWSPRRNPIGHGICPMYPKGVDPTVKSDIPQMQDYAQNRVHTMCSHRLPYGPECPPSLNAPPRTPIPCMLHAYGEAWRSAHAPTVARAGASCRSRPPNVRKARSSRLRTCSSGTRVN